MSATGIIGHYIKTICQPENLRAMVSPSGLRAIGKLFALGALMAVALPAQIFVADPLFRDRDTVPQLMGRLMNRIMGIDVKFTGVAPVTDRPMIYIGNHLSWMDSTVMGATLPGALVPKAETSHFPVVGAFGRAVGSIYVERGHHGAALANAHAQAVRTLNSGRGIVLFPEGRSSDGTGVLPFKSGFLSVLFNNASSEKLERDVGVQPFALRITHLNGEKISGPSQLKDIFSWYSTWTPETFWKVLQQKSMNVEVTGFPVMNPKDYRDHHEFTAAAEKMIRDKVLSP